MSPDRLLFETTMRSDGLRYIGPLPVGHRAYRLRDLLLRAGRAIDAWFFR